MQIQDFYRLSSWEKIRYAESSDHVQATGAMFQLHEKDTVCVRRLECENHLFSNMSVHLRREAQGLDVHQFHCFSDMCQSQR